MKLLKNNFGYNLNTILSGEIVLGLFNLTKEQQTTFLKNYDIGKFTDSKNDYITLIREFPNSDKILINDQVKPGSDLYFMTDGEYYTGFFTENDKVYKRSLNTNSIGTNIFKVSATIKDGLSSKSLSYNNNDQSYGLDFLKLKMVSNLVQDYESLNHGWDLYVADSATTYKKIDSLEISLWNDVDKNDGSRSLVFNTFILFCIVGTNMYPFYLYSFPSSINSNKVVFNFPELLIGGI